MVIKQLYESLRNSLNEARIQRTIDKKLWLTVSSICSRNKSTEAEFIKPLSKMSKEELLQRYVAALLIMKKSCPNSIADIDTIKTFKLIAKQYLSLGGTINEIKQLYINNGGQGVTIEKPVNQKITSNIENKLENDLKKSTDKQVQEFPKPEEAETLQTEEDEDIIVELPEGMNDYDTIFKYVKNKFNDISEICRNIYDIIEQTYYILNKTFYKIDFGDETLYFNKVYTDLDKKTFIKNVDEIYINWALTKKTRLIQGTAILTVNNMSLNSVKIENNNIQLYDKIYIKYDDFILLLKTILSKLLYIRQKENSNPLQSEEKVLSTPFGTYNEDNIDFSKPVNKSIIRKITQNLIKKYFKNSDAITYLLKLLLETYRMGNEKDGKVFKIQNTNDLISTSAGFYAYELDVNRVYFSGKNNEYYAINIWHIRYYNDNDNMSLSWNKPYTIKVKEFKNIIYNLMAYILYYNNNYQNLI